MTARMLWDGKSKGTIDNWFQPAMFSSSNLR
jgi:hypothetical protein